MTQSTFTASPPSHPGFAIERDEAIAELNARAIIYRHEKTGARLLSVIIDDENKVFGVTFRTPPNDSTGLPHILEHSVLGGSQKYPLKDPFFELVKGSMKTFLNAFTSPDKTVYPVASTNLKDFYNLVDVYIDSVFFPLLTPFHLDQEGWHYELDSPDGEMTFKGVVFNEMKGVYSSPDSLVYRHSQQTLYPDTPYRNDSGGDPQAIPDLTYADFKRFHETYYHPSNAIFYFYGDDDPNKRLSIAADLLDKFSARPVHSEIPLQTPLSQPRRYTFPYGVDALEEDARKTMISINWLLGEKNDVNLNYALSVLSYVLIGSQAAPLRKALLDSGLGEDVQGGVGAGLRQMSFSAGMKNIRSADAGAVETLVLETLRAVAESGFDPELVEAAVNSIEFSLRENNTGGSPRGLSLMMRALNTWLYGGDPLQSIRFEAPLAWLKRELASNPTLLQDLIRTWLIDNPHRVTVILEPDTARNQEMEAEEQGRLRAARSAMTPEQIAATIANTQALKERQNTPDTPEVIALLPSIRLEDLEPYNRTTPSEELQIADIPTLWHDLETSGIVYLTLAWEMRHLPQELLPWADLFGQTLTQMGTHREDYVKLAQRIGRKTGGIGASNFTSSIQGSREVNARFTLGGKATIAQTPDMLEIMADVLANTRLDNRDRLRQIVLRNKTRTEASLIPAGNSYVSSRLAAGFTTAGWADEQLDGIENLFFLRRVAEQIESDFPAVLRHLEAVRDLLLTRAEMVANLTVNAAGLAQIQSPLTGFLAALPDRSADLRVWTPAPPSAVEGLVLPSQVNYVGKAANLYDAGYRYHGSVNVITNLARSGWLLEKIRVQGGAYGASIGFSRPSGVVAFTSYRDPNLLNTLEVYDRTPHYLRNLDLSQSELTRAIIGAISSFDPYMLPDARGNLAFHRWLVGDTDERMQQIRDEILGATVHRIKEFADVLETGLQNARISVLGSADAIAKASSAAQSAHFVTTKVM